MGWNDEHFMSPIYEFESVLVKTSSPWNEGHGTVCVDRAIKKENPCLNRCTVLSQLGHACITYMFKLH